MKNKYWALILGALFLICLALSMNLLLGSRTPPAAVQVWSDGKLVATLDLSTDRILNVEGTYGTNVVTVRDGTVGVTQADCPDRYCMQRGFCSDGAQIVCLPNRLVIRFVGKQTVDGVVG